MAKDPDAIYREIAEHRDQMSRKRGHLQERLTSDLHGVSDRVRERTPDAASNVGETVSTHPLSSIAGGFGLGVLMGMTTSGVSLGRGKDGQQASRDGRQPSDGGGGGGLTSALSGSFVSAFEDAVRPMMRDLMAGFKGDDRPPEQREQQAQ